MAFTEFAIPLGGAGSQPGASVPGRWFAPGPAIVEGAPVLVLALGAGAPQAHPFMVTAATHIAARGVAVATFDFEYMARRKKVPDRAPALEACWLAAIAAVRAKRGQGDAS